MVKLTGKLAQAYKDGETFRTYCLHYGVVVDLHDWNDPVDGKPVRLYNIHVDGMETTIEMKCGNVVAWSYTSIQELV